MMAWSAGTQGGGGGAEDSSGATEATAATKGFKIMGFEFSEGQAIIGCGAGAALVLLTMFISGLGKRGDQGQPPATREEAPWRY
jgi:hypothetical protein